MKREEIINILHLSEKRMKHTLGVEKAALELAHRHFPDIPDNEVITAALLHDFTKEYTVSEHQEAYKKYCIPDYDDSTGGVVSPKLYHARTAAYIAKTDFGVSDEVFSAILYHTTGKKNMSPLEIIIYFADYIDEYRTHESCIMLRQQYYKYLETMLPEDALNKALVLSFDITISGLIEEGRTIHINTVEARNTFVEKSCH